MDIQYLQKKKIAILGFGKEGKSTLKFLLKHKIQKKNITILDQKSGENNYGIQHISGIDYLDTIGNYDIIFKTPGIPRCEKINTVAEKITSQTQMFFDNYPGKVIAITASKGKSTMSSLCHHILKTAGFNTKLVGNIGNPVLDEIELGTSTEYDYIVYELSSYMLHNLKKKNYLSVLGSLFPDHLDWHGGINNYYHDKYTILKGSKINIIHSKSLEQYQNQQYRYPRGDTTGKEKTQTPVVYFYGEFGNYSLQENTCYHDGKKIFEIKTQLLGKHNLENILGCVAIAKIIGIDNTIIKTAISSFIGLAHRLEYVGKYQGIHFYDDAISTTPESTIAAIEALGPNVDTIFLGGTDRGYDFSQLIDILEKYSIKNIVLFPKSGEKIHTLLSQSNQKYTILNTQNMKEAVDFAIKNTDKGKICLLSTASPSYSLRKNFEEKGDSFQQCIKNY